jgi:hypothetical protein
MLGVLVVAIGDSFLIGVLQLPHPRQSAIGFHVAVAAEDRDVLLCVVSDVAVTVVTVVGRLAAVSRTARADTTVALACVSRRRWRDHPSTQGCPRRVGRDSRTSFR